MRLVADHLSLAAGMLAVDNSILLGCRGAQGVLG